MTGRRAFVYTMTVGAVAWHGRAYAQPAMKVPSVGYLGRNSAAIEAFMDGLRGEGYVIGETLRVDVRIARESTAAEYAALGASLVAAGMDVIVAANPQALDVITRTTRTIPVVGVDFESDPVARGWCSCRSRCFFARTASFPEGASGGADALHGDRAVSRQRHDSRLPAPA
jgi:hypothetical protein